MPVAVRYIEFATAPAVENALLMLRLELKVYSLKGSHSSRLEGSSEMMCDDCRKSTA